MKFASTVAAIICLTSATFLCADNADDDLKRPPPPQSHAVVQEAEIVLDAPSTCRIGELVRLDASESVADSFEWRLIPDSVDFEVYDQGRRAVFSARAAGTYTFVVAAATEGGAIDVIIHKIRVLTPPPVPDIDDLALLIPYWNWTLELPSDKCHELADVFDTLAARDDLITPEDWIAATAAANRAFLEGEIATWAPLLDKISEILAKKAADGALITPEDHQKEWRRIAEGLRAC